MDECACARAYFSNLHTCFSRFQTCRFFQTQNSNSQLAVVVGRLAAAMAGCKVSLKKLEAWFPWRQLNPLLLCRIIIMLCLDTRPSTDLAPLDEEETRLESAVRIAGLPCASSSRRLTSPPCFSWYVVAFLSFLLKSLVLKIRCGYRGYIPMQLLLPSNQRNHPKYI